MAERTLPGKDLRVKLHAEACQEEEERWPEAGGWPPPSLPIYIAILDRCRGEKTGEKGRGGEA